MTKIKTYTYPVTPEHMEVQTKRLEYIHQLLLAAYADNSNANEAVAIQRVYDLFCRTLCTRSN